MHNWEKIMATIIEKLSQKLPQREVNPEKRVIKTVLLVFLGILILMVVASILTFFLTLDSKEETMVPEMVGMELMNAQIMLQERELVPHVQLQYSTELGDRGTVLSQHPNPGYLLKAGQKVS